MDAVETRVSDDAGNVYRNITSTRASLRSRKVSQQGTKETTNLQTLRGVSARKKFRGIHGCFLLAEFLEARIVPQRIEHRIEPEQRRSERHVCSQCAIVRYREQFL